MLILKIGGGKEIHLEGIISDLAQQSEPALIVHGANAFRDELALQLDWPKQVVTSVSGYQSVFSDERALDLLMMAYAGLRNKRIVELCQQQGVNAVGLSGLDGKVIQGRRNRGIRVQEGEKQRMLRDFSGKPKKINSELLELLLDNGYTPVLCVPILDENSYAINSENDDITALLQSHFQAEIVVNFIEAPGFLESVEDPSSLVPHLSQDELQEREAQVEGRMKRKLLGLRKLFEAGPTRVVITDGRVEHPLQNALQGIGTVIE